MSDHRDLGPTDLFLSRRSSRDPSDLTVPADYAGGSEGDGRLVLAPPRSPAGGLQSAFGRYAFRRIGQAEHGHVVVDRFVVTRSDRVGLVPDADAPVPTAWLKLRHAGKCGSFGSRANRSRSSTERQYWIDAAPGQWKNCSAPRKPFWELL